MNRRGGEPYEVPLGQSLAEAMWALERGAVGIALVVDPYGRLVGTVTDGDIRRALLSGVSLQAPVANHMQRKFTYVDPGATRAEVIELMQARAISQVPILDADGRLLGIHLLRELLGRMKRPNWAVVMAGGKGTRLRPITEFIPKPMIRVAGRPILERLVLHLVGYGIQRIFLSINYLGQIVEDHFGDGERFGCRIEYLREDRPLGTGGALSLLPELPEEPLLVMNGDLVTQADIGALLEFHTLNAYCATVGLREYTHTVPFGCIQLDGHCVTAIDEKPVITNLVNAGIYVFEPHVLDQVPDNQEFPMTTLLEGCLRKGERVGGFQINDDWIDVGQHDQLRLAREGII